MTVLKLLSMIFAKSPPCPSDMDVEMHAARFQSQPICRRLARCRHLLVAPFNAASLWLWNKLGGRMWPNEIHFYWVWSVNSALMNMRVVESRLEKAAKLASPNDTKNCN